MLRIVVLGGGRSGTLVANALCQRVARSAAGDAIVTVVDRDDARIHRDRLFVVPFGVCRVADVVAPRGSGLHPDANYLWSAIDRVDVEGSTVVLAPGTRLPYDVLVVAAGSRARPDLTPGLTGWGWRQRMFELGTLDGATMLQIALRSFERGRLVIDSVEQPVRRPLNLLRFAMLAQSYFLQRGTRDQVDIAFAAPLAGAFETRHASLAFTRMLSERGVRIESDFRTALVDGERGMLRSAAGREVPFDLLVTLPVRAGAAFVERSRLLGDGRGFVRCDAQTRQALGAPNVFAVGAARGGMTGAAEMSASVEARLVAENVWRRARGRPLVRGLEELTPGWDPVERPVALGGLVPEPVMSQGPAPAGVVVVDPMATELRAGPHPHTWTLNVPVGRAGASAASAASAPDGRRRD